VPRASRYRVAGTAATAPSSVESSEAPGVYADPNGNQTFIDSMSESLMDSSKLASGPLETCFDFTETVDLSMHRLNNLTCAPVTRQRVSEAVAAAAGSKEDFFKALRAAGGAGGGPDGTTLTGTPYIQSFVRLQGRDRSSSSSSSSTSRFAAGRSKGGGGSSSGKSSPSSMFLPVSALFIGDSIARELYESWNRITSGAPGNFIDGKPIAVVSLVADSGGVGSGEFQLNLTFAHPYSLSISLNLNLSQSPFLSQTPPHSSTPSLFHPV